MGAQNIHPASHGEVQLLLCSDQLQEREGVVVTCASNCFEKYLYTYLVLENTSSFLKSSILHPTMSTLYIQPDAVPLAGSLFQMSMSSLDHIERLLSRSLGRDTTGTGTGTGTCMP